MQYRQIDPDSLPKCTVCREPEVYCECESFSAPKSASTICRNCHETEANCDCGEFSAAESEVRGPWVICPTCEGDGHHSRHLGSYTQSEFYEAFDDEESRQMYFNGGYDKTCHTCEGSGKIRANDKLASERLRAERESERINETGYNDAGEFVAYPDWYKGTRY